MLKLTGAVHQFHPVVTLGDAISNHIISLQRLLRAMGSRSEIYAEHPQASFEVAARRIHQSHSGLGPEDIVLLHYSIGYSPQAIRWVNGLPARKVLIYHNVTPADYFLGVSNAYREAAWLGRQQLGQLISECSEGWGDSEYNCQELRAAGMDSCRVLPIIFDPTFYDVPPDPVVVSQLREGPGPIMLFVGRVAPNKRLEDIIVAFHHLKCGPKPDARLYLVGSHDQMEPYLRYLQALVARLHLEDVHFVGHVSKAELVAYYRCADLYLSMSEHEGFGVPLVEAMHFGVPVIAFSAAAVPQTMSNSGILILRKRYHEIAELIAVLVDDQELRAKLVARQSNHIRQFHPQSVSQILTRNLEALH